MKTNLLFTVTIFTAFIRAFAAPPSHTHSFITIGNTENTGNTYIDNYGNSQTHGAVDYAYNIAKYETTITQWEKFYNDPDSNKVGSFRSDYDRFRSISPNTPAVYLNFYQAAQYCNWLTTGNATNGAYAIDGEGQVISIKSRSEIVQDYNNNGIVTYVIPTEDEWYKAAYFKNTTYTLYADGGMDSNNPPLQSVGDGWNYYDDDGWLIGHMKPWAVGSGGEEQNGTFDMMGNIWEWMEDPTGVIRGGSLDSPENRLRSSFRYIDYGPDWEAYGITLRVAAIPEPTTALLLIPGLSGLMALRKRRRSGILVANKQSSIFTDDMGRQSVNPEPTTRKDADLYHTLGRLEKFALDIQRYFHFLLPSTTTSDQIIACLSKVDRTLDQVHHQIRTLFTWQPNQRIETRFVLLLSNADRMLTRTGDRLYEATAWIFEPRRKKRR